VLGTDAICPRAPVRRCIWGLFALAPGGRDPVLACMGNPMRSVGMRQFHKAGVAPRSHAVVAAEAVAKPALLIAPAGVQGEKDASRLERGANSPKDRGQLGGRNME